MDESEEGVALHRLSRGAYGFTYAPHADDIPVFLKQNFQSFEVHKLPDGAEHLVGFVSAEHAGLVEQRSHNVEITLYPEPHANADRLVSLLLDEIVPSKKGPSRADGNYLGVHLP